jgi:hypothetical protein
MILGKLSQSLKEQNWTAIWIEFVLLAAGVFLGIQASNWNEQRVTNKKAEMFTERLRADLRVEMWRFSAINFYYDDVLINARETLAALEGRSTLSNEALLIAAYRATQYAEYVQYRATYDELTSTGNIGLVADPSLRKMATETYSTALYKNIKDEGINSPYRVAFRMLVPIDVQEAVAAKCGDTSSDIGDYEGIKNPLNYDCTTGLTPQEIDNAAAILRADPRLAPLLRLRIANIYSAVSTMVMSNDVLTRLRALSGKGKAQ